MTISSKVVDRLAFKLFHEIRLGSNLFNISVKLHNNLDKIARTKRPVTKKKV